MLQLQLAIELHAAGSSSTTNHLLQGQASCIALQIKLTYDGPFELIPGCSLELTPGWSFELTPLELAPAFPLVLTPVSED